MTVGELLALYQQHHLCGKVSAPYYARLVRQVFPPILAAEVDQIPIPVLLDWWKSLWDRPGHANKALGLLRASHRWAVGLGLVSTHDQTSGLVKRPEVLRSQTTSPEEWARLVPHLEDLRLRHRVYFWSLYLVGSRPGEIRAIQVSQIMLDREIPGWIHPKGKNGKPQMVPLPEQLVPLWRLLLLSHPPGATYLFWGEHPRRAWGRTSAQKMWERIRNKAGLSHLWLNDLRRSTASDLLNQGESLGVIQSQLGHRSLSQTAKYAWLAVQPLAGALQRRTDGILARL